MSTPASAEKPALLEVAHLSMHFGGVVAIDDVSFTAYRRDITAIIGPNGAGKTTVFNCLTGFYRPSAGHLGFARDGKILALEKLQGYRIAREAGVARTFQSVCLFAGMTVLENLIVAQHRVLTRASVYNLGGLFGLKRHRRAERDAVEKARDWLDRLNLTDRANDAAGTLPYGQQRRLEIARAMCTDPTLLCVDEPAGGLNPNEKAGLAHLLISIRDTYGTHILFTH